MLAYHEVADPDQFAQHMDYVASIGEPVTERQVRTALAEGAGLPPGAILVTFDDGHRSVLEAALPVLQHRAIPAVAYVIAGLLDTNVPYWWDEVEALIDAGGTSQLLEAKANTGGDEIEPKKSAADVVRALKRLPNTARLAVLEELRATAEQPAPRMPQLKRAELAELEDGGIAVGNHTLTHPCLDQCTAAEIAHELAASNEVLEETLGHPVRTFAYPNGNCNADVLRIVRAQGFESAFLFDHRVSSNPPDDRLRISRLRVDSTTSMDRFKIILSGLHPAIHHTLGRA